MNIKITPITPHQFQELLTTNTVFYGYHKLPAGKLLICTLNNNIIAAAFCEPKSITEQEILKKFPALQTCDQQHLTNLLNQKTINLITTGTEFQNNVWQAATAIPTGTTLTYQQLAMQLGKPKAFRAAANALASNKIAYFIPCHRIVRTNGALGGYRWGIDAKTALLDFEKQTL